jgi:F0F1-type ATP synthase assembly protein I
LVSTVSFQLAGSILLGVFLGRYLDRWLGTTPWLMLVGLFLGLTAGITGIIKITKQFFRKEK